MTFAAAAVAVPLAPQVATSFAAEDAAGSQPTAQASVVKVDRKIPPQRKVVHRKFKPWAKPSPSQARAIIRAEAKRWGIPASSLTRRVACESRFHWWAQNGQYQGLLQFAYSTFARGMRTIRSRRVRLVREKVRRVHETRVTTYSDGTKKERRGRARHQRLVVIYTGRLPRNPAHSHGWSQLRIGAQAIRGISAVHSSEWACSA